MDALGILKEWLEHRVDTDSDEFVKLFTAVEYTVDGLVARVDDLEDELLYCRDTIERMGRYGKNTNP